MWADGVAVSACMASNSSNLKIVDHCAQSHSVNINVLIWRMK